MAKFIVDVEFLNEEITDADLSMIAANIAEAIRHYAHWGNGIFPQEPYTNTKGVSVSPWDSGITITLKIN